MLHNTYNSPHTGQRLSMYLVGCATLGLALLHNAAADGIADKIQIARHDRAGDRVGIRRELLFGV